MPYPWSRGTKGRQLATPIHAPLPPLSDGGAVDAFMAKYKGNLKNTILLADRPRAIRPETAPAFRRYTDAELTELAEARPAAAPPQEKNDPQSGPTAAELSERLDRFLRFLEEEGVIAVATVASGSAGRIVLDGRFGDRMKAHSLGPSAIQLAPESYNRLVRLLEKNVPVQVELELESSFHDIGHFSVVGELPGSAKKNEVVLLAAHLDSWHGGTGATDNAAVVAVLLEAMRILSASGLRMDRTIRVALWGGHEIGGQGSQQYIKKHHATSRGAVTPRDASSLYCYFNLDFGAGRIRGLYTQGNERWAPIFRSWLTPFQEMSAATVSNQTAGGSDHIFFKQAGLPAFPFIQDPLAYWTRTHHTNVDVFDYLIEEDLRQSAAILAAVAYQAAMFDQPLPQGNDAR